MDSTATNARMVGVWEGRWHRLPVEESMMVGVRRWWGLVHMLGGDQICISSGYLTLVWRLSRWKQRTTEVLMGEMGFRV